MPIYFRKSYMFKGPAGPPSPHDGVSEFTGQYPLHAHQVPWICDVTRCFVYSYFIDKFSAVLFSCGTCTNKTKPPPSGVNHPLTYPPWQFDKEWPFCLMWVLSCYSLACGSTWLPICLTTFGSFCLNFALWIIINKSAGGYIFKTCLWK